ncbi:tape measure domain-containing protein [Acidovorax sp. 56]|uniref:tape measure protein n=1 Tax=Acidovorax sp. 56 TaxID=2035205 RepID=UPI000C16F11D|nr:tape measure protein [Acidovorax sp. 56]PIF29420.1 tape measure domain-containing protein [Acidovorax sp. 56]
MADPKIKYDIEAAVKGEADAEQLAKTLRGVGDVLEGDLQEGALAAAQALESLASKQRAIDTFSALKRETKDLEGALTKATAQVDRLGTELPQATSSTQALVAAERSAATALEQARASLQSKRDALKTVREETQGAARRSDEYKTTVAGLKDGIKAATAEIKAQQDTLRTTGQATTQAQNAEAALRKEYELAIGSSVRLSTELGNKRRALSETREIMQSVGVSTSNLAQSEATLKAAVAQVRQEVATMAPAYQSAAAASSQSTQVQAQNQRTLREGMTSISTQLQRIQQIATAALGGSYVGGLAKSVAETADEFRNLEARVKLATGEGPQFTKSFGEVQRIALSTNSALDETGTLFARLTKASQEGGLAAVAAQQRALGLTQTINQAIQLSGGSAESSKAAITQLVQGLQGGALRGDEFNSVMEQSPRLAQAMADGLGVTTGELRKLAEQGALTSETVMRALEGQADAVAGEFGKLPATVGRALQNLSSQWTIYVGNADKGLLSSANAAKVINALASNLDTVVSTLTAAGKAWAAIKIAGLVADFAKWATSTMAATKAVEANTVATASNTAAQRVNATAQAQTATAQAANTAATTANTAARAANAKAWGDIGAFARAGAAAQATATAATTASTAALAANTAAAARGGIVWRSASALMGPWGIAVAALTPEILSLTRALGEQTAKAMGWGKVMEEAEAKLRQADEAAKIHAETLRRQALLYEEARNRSFDLTNQSKGLIAEFDKLTKAGESSSAAIAKIGKDFDPSTTQGIRDMSGALDKLAADGKISADQVKQAWITALDGQDLAKFEVLARNAFAAAGQEAQKLSIQIRQAVDSGASPEVVAELQKRLQAAMSVAAREGERVAQMMDTVLNAAVARTGVEFSALEGRISATSRSAINDLDTIIGGLDRLKAQGLDAGRALEASFVKALDTADSQRAVDEVRSRIEGLRRQLGDKVADGLLDQAKQKTIELSEALDKAKPGINSIAEAMKQLGITSDASLKDTAAQARVSYDAMAQSGKASAREMSDAFKVAAEAAIKANNGIPPSWVTAQASTRGYKLEVDDAGRTTLEAMKRAGDSIGGVESAHRSAAGAARDQVGAVQSLASAYTDAAAKAQAANGQFLDAALTQKNADTSASSITNKKASESQFAWTRSTIIDYLTQAGVDDIVAEQASKQFLNSRGGVDYEASSAQKRWAGDFGTLAEALGKVAEFYKYDESGKHEAAYIIEQDKKNKEAADKNKSPASPAPSPTPSPAPTPSNGSGSGSNPITRVVNVYIGNSTPYSVPTNEDGQKSIEAIAREVLRLLELQRNQLGY